MISSGPRIPEASNSRLAQFVAIAAGHRIKPLFVFFDSCWDPFPRPGPSARPDLGCTTPAGCKARVLSTSMTAGYSAFCMTTSREC